MRLSRTVLIALAGAALLLVVAALAGPMLIDRLNGGRGGGDRIAIAIATDQSLRAFYALAERDVEEAGQVAEVAMEQQVAQAREGTADVTTAGQAANPTPAAPNGERTQATANRDVLEAFIVTTLDQLGGELTEELSASGRFAVTEPSSLLGALRDLNDERESSGVPLLQRFMFWRNQSQTPQRTTESAEMVVSTQREGADLARAGNQLNVNYVLFVGLASEGMLPHFVYDSGAVQATLDPTVIYRVFDVRTQTVVLAGVEPLRPQLAITIDPLSSLEIHQQLMRALNERIARVVARRLADELAPARLVASGNALMINRGAVDGVRVDDVYPIAREGEVVRDLVSSGDNVATGASLGRPRTPVGQVRVVSVEENFATVTTIEGEPAARDVVLVQQRQRGGSGATAAGSSGGRVALGANAIRDQQRGVRPRATVAVGRVNVELLEPDRWRYPNTIEADLARRFGDGLTQDRRITVINRADRSRIMAERTTQAASRGDYDTDVAEGVALADYQVIGEVRLSSRNVGRTISVGGQSRQVDVAPRLYAEAAFRVLDVDGRQIDSIAVSVNRAGAATNATAVNEIVAEVAQAASAQILVALFPIEVAAINGDQIVLTRGSEAGLRAGARLRAYRIGEAVRDQYTGDVVSEGARTHIGDLVVVEAPEGAATARFAARAFGLQVNDRLEIGEAAAAATARQTPRANEAPADPTGGVRF